MTLHSIMNPSPMRMANSDDRKELAYKLFIELLAYQLASPVRWIETQDRLLCSDLAIRRFIEIGPRTILATMARKTAAKRHESHAASQWLHLKFFSYQDHQDDIFYHYDYKSPKASEEADPPTPPVPGASHSPRASVSASDGQHSASANITSGAIGSRPSKDFILSASHIALAMTAQKVRRAFNEVSMEKTIRDLSGGKSTLQNELTGDLVAEFGKVPEGVEDMSLAALGEALQSGFVGKPSKQMMTLISRLISSKMPAGFNQNAIYDYLQSRWGLSRPHSIIPMCFAVTVEPPTRLDSAEAARKYLDELISRYAAFQEICFTPATEMTAGHSVSQPVLVDSASLEAIRTEQNNLQRKQLNLLANHLGIQPGDSGGEAEQSQASDRELEEKLSKWNGEFDDQFFQGVQPIFNLKKSRQYDAWWNWAREELIRWLNDVSRNVGDIILATMDDRLRRTLNRWDSSCTEIVTSWLATSCPGRSVSHLPPASDIRPVLNEILRLGTKAQLFDPVYIHTEPPLGPRAMILENGRLEYQEVERAIRNYPDVVRQGRVSSIDGKVIPFIHIKTRQDEEDWQFDRPATERFHATLDVAVNTGLTYSGKSVLVTGAGRDSIGAKVVQGLLAGGARVVVTTSREMAETATFYQTVYRQFGARGSTLTVIPSNQASKQDCEALVEYIFGESSPTGGDVDYVVPFAAIPQAGELDKLGGRQELALRAMLVNLIRLVGLVCREKERRRIDARPTMVVLPMSCNEGTFGGDGLYAESKLGLKTLFNRFHSETWSIYVTVCGAVIGWTRGTGLMRSSNMVAAEMEKLGVITFTQSEMALNILALLTPAITTIAEETPVYADLTGGFGSMWKIKDQIASARQKLADELQLRNALAEEDSRHRAVLLGEQPAQPSEGLMGHRLANLGIGFPRLDSSHRELTSNLPYLQGMVDLSHAVVVVGFSELGPWGNSRTRWEMEHQGQFTLEGYVEMAWMMGLIRHIDGDLKGEPYVGWVDSETGSPIADSEIPQKYRERIMAHAGLRIIEPDSQDSYDPQHKEYLHEVAVEEDLPPFECPKSTAEAFKLRHGDNVTIQSKQGTEDCQVFVKRGAVLMIPKMVPFEQVVAGKVPNGWDPLRYGIPEDIVQQVDITTLYALCCVSEAFLSAGIKDPYEIYEYTHVSEVANCLGTGGGPMKIIRNMYRDRFLDRPIRGDIMTEHFMNTMGAWVNMLLVSATGPLKTPVGACATALESLDTGCEAIQSGKCKVAVVGGCDDYTEELAFEFANIKATANSTEELANGRLPREISRPTASSRSGFAESAGCGVQILMNAELALKMGLPIYGIVAYSQMASDQIGRSIPAPGRGVLTAARETREAKLSPLLDFNFRRAHFDGEVADMQQDLVSRRLPRMKAASKTKRDQGLRDMGHTMMLRVRDIQHRWANNIRLQDPSVSPIKAALATWGLTVDDIGVASMHGTSTKANEVNEGDVINTQMTHLGRCKGNPLLSVCQKSLTGHPKAAAGAWQLNGCIQMMRDGIVPGNRNADNVDEKLRKYEHLVYQMESIQTEVKATMLTSFGFGQKGAMNITVAPKYLFTSISSEVFDGYCARVTKRQRFANPEFVRRLLNGTLVQVKSQPPWSPEAMQAVFLDPTSRLHADQSNFSTDTSTHSMPATKSKPQINGTEDKSTTVNYLAQSMIREITQRSTASAATGVGVDVESIASINIENEIFIERNFTPAEHKYCLRAPNPRASFAGRWSAKEAVFKCLKTSSLGGGAPMHEIEILSDKGVPRVILYGYAREVANSKGISDIEVTISHSAETAIAVALARRDRCS